MAEITLKQLEDSLSKQRTDIESSLAKFKTEVDSGNTKVIEKVAELEKQLSETKSTLNDVNEKIKKSKEFAIPGLGDELKKKNFDFGCFLTAALKSKKTASETEAWKGAEYEKEILWEYAKKRDMIAGDGSQGGYLIPEEVSNEIVTLTLAKMPIYEMGANFLTGLVGDLPIPKQLTRSTGYWVGETEAPTESTNSFGEFTLRPKKCGAFTKFSKRLSYQTRGTADRIVRESLTDGLALTMHLGYLSGTGADSQPKGIITNSGSFTSTSAIGTNGGLFRIDKAAAMIQAIDTADELIQGGNFGFIMRPEVLGGMRRERVAQFTGQPIGQGQPISADLIMSNEMLEQRIGYKIRTTTQLSATESKGTSSTCSQVLFGNWKQFYVGMWRDLEIKVSDVASDASGNSAFLKDQFFVVAFQETDSNVGRATAFTMISDAETNESNWSNG